MKVKQLMVVAALGLCVRAGAQELVSAVIQDAYSRIAPAVCVVNYSSNITNPSSGEVSKRNTRALGLIVSPEGLVMAHGHMQIENSDPFNITVIVGQGDSEKTFTAKLLKKPEDVNVCFVQIANDKQERFPYAQFSRRPLHLGETVMLIGLLGDSLDFNRSVITRRIGSILEKPRRTYCLDERVLFGYVGSPVVNHEGKIVGVIGFDLSAGEGGDLYVRSGHPLVYQTELFAQYIAKPPTEKELNVAKEEAFLGVFTQPLTDDLAEYWGLPQSGGVVIGTLMPGSPAEAAGMQTGDVIVNFDGVTIQARQDREVITFTKLVRDAGIGRSVPVRLLRDGQPVDLTVTLVERPKSTRDAGEFEDEVFGLTVREITTDLRIALNLPQDVQGVIVRRVKSGSWAALAEIEPYVIIMNFGGHPVDSLEAFKEAVNKAIQEKPAEVTVFCRIGSRTGFFRMKPRWENVATSKAP